MTTAAAAVVNWPALLTSSGLFLISLAASVFLLCTIPTLWAVARLALSAASLLRQVERELPETAAVLRLSGMEVADCISEVSKLGGDLSSGMRSTARLLSMTETSVKQAASVAGQQVKPALASSESKARGAVEAALQERAQLRYTGPVMAQLCEQTSSAVRKLRLGVAMTKVVAAAAVHMGRAVRSSAMQVAGQSDAAQRSTAVEGIGAGEVTAVEQPPEQPPRSAAATLEPRSGTP